MGREAVCEMGRAPLLIKQVYKEGVIMNKLSDKWQKETLIAHCITGYEAINLVRKDNLWDEVGCWKLSVFESGYAKETFVVPPKYLALKAVNMFRKNSRWFHIEKLVLKIPNARIVYDVDCDKVAFTQDYIKILNYIREISWGHFEKQGKDK